MLAKRARGFLWFTHILFFVSRVAFLNQTSNHLQTVCLIVPKCAPLCPIVLECPQWKSGFRGGVENRSNSAVFQTLSQLSGWKLNFNPKPKHTRIPARTREQSLTQPVKSKDKRKEKRNKRAKSYIHLSSNRKIRLFLTSKCNTLEVIRKCLKRK